MAQGLIAEMNEFVGNAKLLRSQVLRSSAMRRIDEMPEECRGGRTRQDDYQQRVHLALRAGGIGFIAALLVPAERRRLANACRERAMRFVDPVAVASRPAKWYRSKIEETG